MFNNQLISESSETNNTDTSSVASNLACGELVSNSLPPSTSFPTALQSESSNSPLGSRSSTPTGATKSNSLNQHSSNQFQLDSDSSDDEEDSVAEEAETLSIPSEVLQTLSDPIDPESNQPTMWLGTEDGW